MVDLAEIDGMVQSGAGSVGLFDVRGQLIQRPRGDSTTSDAIHGVPMNVNLVFIVIIIIIIL